MLEALGLIQGRRNIIGAGSRIISIECAPWVEALGELLAGEVVGDRLACGVRAVFVDVLRERRANTRLHSLRPRSRAWFHLILTG